jgi:hypothetical protein
MTDAQYWPSASDYSEAVQNARSRFKDEILRQAKVLTNDYGIPMSSAGNYAVVYQAMLPTGSKALRCFIRSPQPDQQERYAALADHLHKFWLPELVSFEYQLEGIKIRDRWFPIVLMEWVKGRRLDIYVQDCLARPEEIGRLAANWRGVVASLAGANTAHGDLQHGNVLVDEQGVIRLVDYDGMFLPVLRGREPNERGHASYQHPERLAQGHYQENADAFSALVIYLSLRALQIDPRLWDAELAGDGLLFKKDDFESPGRTPIWQKLRNSTDDEVRQLNAYLAQFCTRPVAEVPSLEELLRTRQKTVSQSSRPKRDSTEHKDEKAPRVISASKAATASLVEQLYAPPPPPPVIETPPAQPADLMPPVPSRASRVSLWSGCASIVALVGILVLSILVGIFKVDQQSLNGLATFLLIGSFLLGGVGVIAGLRGLFQARSAQIRYRRRAAVIGLVAGSIPLLFCGVLVYLGSTGQLGP